MRKAVILIFFLSALILIIENKASGQEKVTQENSIEEDREKESSRYFNLVDSADNYIRREAWDKAEATLIEALREEPANFSNYLIFSNLGVVRMNKGDLAGAKEAFDLGLSISPNSTVLLNNRAQLNIMEEKYSEALADLDKSLNIDSKQEWPHSMRALLLTYQGKNNLAKEEYLHLIQEWPENSTGYLGLGHIYEIENDFESAAKQYQKAWDIEKTPEAISMLVLIKIKVDKYSEASALIREGLEIFPEEPMLYLWRGYLNKLNFRNNEAEADRKMAIAKGADPEFVNYYLQ